MAKGHRTECEIFDRLKFTFCIEKFEFYFTLKNQNYFLADPLYILNIIEYFGAIFDTEAYSIRHFEFDDYFYVALE